MEGNAPCPVITAQYVTDRRPPGMGIGRLAGTKQYDNDS